MINNNQHSPRELQISMGCNLKTDSQDYNENSTLQTTNYRPENTMPEQNILPQHNPNQQPLLFPNQLQALDDQLKQKFLSEINGIWMFQEAMQIILSVITIIDYSYDKFFFNFDKGRYRAPLYFFFIISMSQLLLVTFHKPSRNKTNSFFIFLFFTISYSLWVSGLISGYHNDIWNIERSVQIGFAIFIGTICNFLTLITIQIHFSLSQKPIVFLRAYKYVFIPPFIYVFIFTIFNPFDYVAVVMLWMATELWAACFGGLYLYSVLQVVNGKFNLDQEQTITAALLTFVNMFFPFGNF